MKFRSTIPPLRLAIPLLLGCGGTQAAGFNVPEISIGGLGLSNSIVANTRVLGAVPYNPSLAAFHSGTTVSGGLMLARPDAEVTTAAPNTVVTTNFQGKDNVIIPNLSLTHQIDERFTLAFSTTVPFGLSTNFPAGTFSTLGANSPTKSQVEVIDISPSLVFRLSSNTAIAIGVDYYWVRKVAFDTAALANKGDGDGWGWNISASHVAGPWSFGASFRSQAETDISGTTTVTGLGTFGGTRTTFDVPWRAQIGVRYQVDSALALEANISRTGWSSFDILAINHNAPSPPVPNPITSANHWKDSNAYRLSGSYRLSPETELRFGYSFDEGAMPDAFFSARTADADRHLLSVGMEHQLGNGLAIEAGYTFVKLKDQSFRSTTVPVTDPNGTLAYNGDYKTTVHLLGIGLSKRF